MAITPPPIGLSPSHEEDSLSQGKMDDSKFSPIVSSGSPADSRASALTKTKPKPLPVPQDPTVSPDLFSEHSQSLDRDRHEVSARHKLRIQPAPQRQTARGRRILDPKPNLKAARPKRQPDPSPATANRFAVLEKVPDDGQSSSSIQLASLVLHESLSEPDVG